MGLDPNNTEQSPYICCLSAYSEQTFVERAKAAGMHDFMTKPAQIQKIKELLDALKINMIE